MFTVSHPSLPTTPLPKNEVNPKRVRWGVIAAIIRQPTPNNYAPLCTIGTRFKTVVGTRTLPAYTGNTVEIDVSDLELMGIEAIVVAGIRYTSATSLEELQSRQFFWNYYSNKVILKFTDV